MKKHTVRVAISASLAALAVLALGALPAHATRVAGTANTADTVTWSVTPSTPDGPDARTRFDFQAAPGSVINDWVAVTNQSAVQATFSLYAADAATDYETAAFTLIGSAEQSTDAGSWISLAVSEVTLAPGEIVNIPFTATVPADATPGDHSAGIVAVYTTASAGEGVGYAQELRVGSRVHLRVDGPLQPAFGITGQSLTYNGTWNPFGAGQAVAAFDVSNLGNIRISAEPTVTLTGPFGIPLGQVGGETMRELVPGGVGRITVTLDSVPPLLLLFADITLTPVAGEGVSASDTLPTSVTRNAMTWAVPWTLLAALAVLVLGTWGIIALRRRRRASLAAALADYTDRVLEAHAERDGAIQTPQLEGAER